MPPVVDPDHDHRLEVLLKQFFEADFRRFSPDRADRFEFADTPLDWAAEVSRPVGREVARALVLQAGCER